MGGAGAERRSVSQWRAAARRAPQVSSRRGVRQHTGQRCDEPAELRSGMGTSSAPRAFALVLASQCRLGTLGPGHMYMLAAIARPARMFLASFSLVAIAACGGASTQPVSDPQPSATVNATSALRFTPTPVHITVGGTVTFAFGPVEHDVFFDNAPDGAPANISNPTSSTSVSRTFSRAGTFVFNCHIHPGMSGTVIVQ